MARQNVIEDPRRQEMRFPAALIECVDKWRGTQPGVPSRSEAVRRLVELGLKAGADHATA